jgi:hypothetical protein
LGLVSEGEAPIAHCQPGNVGKLDAKEHYPRLIIAAEGLKIVDEIVSTFIYTRQLQQKLKITASTNAATSGSRASATSVMYGAAPGGT